MPRLPKEESDGLMSWDNVGKYVGISGAQARRIGMTALAKMRRGLEARGITLDVFLEYLRQHDAEAVQRHDNLAALLPEPTPAREDIEVRKRRSLRRVRS